MIEVRFATALDSQESMEEIVSLPRVPERDETVIWKTRTWFVADVVTDLDDNALTVVLRTYDQA